MSGTARATDRDDTARAARAACRTAGLVACWVLLGAWTVLRVVTVTAGRVAVFAAELADEVVTARLGRPALLPRARRGWWRLANEWRARRAAAVDGVVDGEIVEEVWR